MRVERAMSQLIFKEVNMHLKAENIKRSLESSYDFSIKSAFKAVDDWNYSYIDKQNLKRFLRYMGHLASKSEIIAILRRFDLDGDAKVNLVEFGEAIKT
jgi:Ca2+-binding EF-hand superfamily protein